MTVPPAVPALPDTQRLTAYSITSQTGPFAVNFALYGDNADFGNWVEVWLNEALLNAATDYTLSSPSGPLGSIALPITDATITLTVASTGTLTIIGARRPRRLTQFTEGRGVAARDLNQAFTDVVAENRETWDRVRTRTISFPGGENVITQLPAVVSRANNVLSFDGSGSVTITPTSQIGASNAAAAAASAAAAAASASTAANAASNASTSANQAAGYAAAAASNGKIYPNTTVGLANTTNGQYFYTPGTGNVALNLYLNSSGVAVLQDQFPSLQAFVPTFVSSSTGNDANTPSPTTPVQTLGHAIAITPSGGTILLKRGDDWFENLPVGNTYMTIDAYGDGGRPRVRGDRNFVGTWVNQGPTYPNVWTLTVTPTFATGGNTYWPGVWDTRTEAAGPFPGNNGVTLLPYLAGANIAASMTFVNANAGTFLAYQQGSTQANIQNSPNQIGPVVFNIHLADGLNPNTTGIVMSYSEFTTVGAWSKGCNIKNIIFMRTASKDFTGNNDTGGGVVENCDFVGAVVHGCVASSTIMRNCYAETANPSLAIGTGGFAFHGFHDTSASGTASSWEVTNCIARGFAIGFGSHGTGGSAEYHNVSWTGCKAIECGVAINNGFYDRGLYVRDFEAIDCSSLVDTQQITTIDFWGDLFFSFKNVAVVNNNFAFSTGGNLTVHDGAVLVSNAPTNLNFGVGAPVCTLYRNSGFGLALPIITLNNVRNCGLIGAYGNAGFATVALVAKNCILGPLSSASPPANFASSFVASNTEFSFQAKTLAQIQAIYAGVDGTCIIPFVTQNISLTIGGGDVSYQDMGNTVTGTAGTSLTVNSGANLYQGSGIQIAGAGPAAGLYTGIIQTIAGTAITVSPATSTNVSGATLTVGGYNKKLFNDLTARWRTDTSQFTGMSDVTSLATGNWIWVGAAGRDRAFGLTKITGFDGTNLSVSPAVWGDNGAMYQPGFPVGSNPSIPIRFSNPFVSTSSSVSINKGGLGILTFADNGTGFNNNLGAGQGIHFGSFYNAVGGPNAFQIDVVNGVINAPFPVNSGDTLTISVVAYIQELDAFWHGYPPTSKRADPDYTSVVARLGLGQTTTR